MRWDNPSCSDITGYQYQAQRGVGFTVGLDDWPHAAGPNATSVVLTGLTNGETYGVLLRATTAGSRTYCFTVLVFVTPSDPSVNQPTGLTAEAVTNTTAPTVKLTWNDPGDNTLGYDVQYRGHPAPVSWTHLASFSNLQLNRPTSGKLSVNVSGLNCGFIYSYDFRIRARSGTGANASLGPYSLTVESIRPR